MILRIVILRILFHHYNSPYSILVCPHSLELPGSGGIKGAVPPLRSQSFGPAQPDWLLALSSSSRLSARLYSVYLIVFVYLCWVNTEASSLDDCPSNLFIQVKVRSWAEPYIWWTCHFRTLTSDEFPNSVIQKSFRTLPFERVFELCHFKEFSNSTIWTSFRTLPFERVFELCHFQRVFELCHLNKRRSQSKGFAEKVVERAFSGQSFTIRVTKALC